MAKRVFLLIGAVAALSCGSVAIERDAGVGGGSATGGGAATGGGTVTGGGTATGGGTVTGGGAATGGGVATGGGGGGSTLDAGPFDAGVDAGCDFGSHTCSTGCCAWQLQAVTVSDAGFLYNPTLAIDSSGGVWVAYSQTSTRVTVGRLSDAGLAIDTTFVGSRGSLAIGPDGLPHVAMLLGDKVVHASRSAMGLWSTELVVDGGAAALSRVRVDSHSAPHVVLESYHSTDPHQLIRADRAGNWNLTTTTTQVAVGQVMLALSTTDEPIIAFDDGSQTNISLVFSDGGVSSVVDGGGVVLTGLAAQAQWALGFSDSLTTYSSQHVLEPSGLDTPPDLVTRSFGQGVPTFDPAGRLHLLDVNGSESTVRYLERTPTGWERSSIMVVPNYSALSGGGDLLVTGTTIYFVGSDLSTLTFGTSAR